MVVVANLQLVVDHSIWIASTFIIAFMYFCKMNPKKEKFIYAQIATLMK